MRRFISATLALWMFALPALAQGSSTGRLVGTVSGPDGAIAGATITIIDNQTKRERTVVASDEGTFAVPQLDAGTYTVTVTAAGFKTFTAADVKIDVGREYSFTPTLELGQISETVIVTAGADILNATSAELSSTVSPRQIQELPLDGRNPLALIQLQPGVASNGATNTSINGQRPTATSITRDGINVQDQFIRESASDFSPQRSTTDNISEFTVTTSNGGAELGSGASHVQQVTQRGTSAFHGAGFIYNRNDYFGANEFFNNAAGRNA
ncbi:MAG: carboxypeptidase regulatory-like domain-containing protein, partial [Pyrinomonadaceae bacterium]